MGAGSAKGVKPENGDGDQFSSSSEQWENDTAVSDDPRKDKIRNNNGDNLTKTVAQVVEPSGSKTGDLQVGEAEEKKEEQKKKTRFVFSRKKDDADKVDEFVNDPSEEDPKNNTTSSSSKKNADKSGKDASSKKDSDKKGFRLFSWRKEESKKGEEKDAALDQDIDDLEKTFDSLGIVGKNLWGDDPPQPRKEATSAAADDLELLEPMRKRKNVRVRGPAAGSANGSGGGSSSNGSTASKRTFKFSWETEHQQPTTMEEEEDEWEYKAVVIEGFDIEKFRKANLRESVFDSTSLPNTVGAEEQESTTGIKSPLRYDQNEQHILATIERDFLR